MGIQGFGYDFTFDMECHLYKCVYDSDFYQCDYKNKQYQCKVMYINENL